MTAASQQENSGTFCSAMYLKKFKPKRNHSNTEKKIKSAEVIVKERPL